MGTTTSAIAPAGLAAGTIIFFAAVAIAAWCVPLVIAALFGLPRKGSIAALSLALGWTGVAWLAALIIVTVGAILANRETPGLPLPGRCTAIPRARPRCRPHRRGPIRTAGDYGTTSRGARPRTGPDRFHGPCLRVVRRPGRRPARVRQKDRSDLRCRSRAV